MTHSTSPFDELVDIVGELVVGLNQAYGPIPSLARLANRLDALRHPVPPKAYTAVNGPVPYLLPDIGSRWRDERYGDCTVLGFERGNQRVKVHWDEAETEAKPVSLLRQDFDPNRSMVPLPYPGQPKPRTTTEQSRFKTTTPTLDDLIATLAPGQRWRDPAYGDFTIRDTMGRSVGLTWDYPNGQLTTVDATAFYPEHGLIRLADAPAVQPRFIVTDLGPSRHPWFVIDQSNRITGEPLEVCACIHEGTARRIADALNAQEGARP